MKKSKTTYLFFIAITLLQLINIAHAQKPVLYLINTDKVVAIKKDIKNNKELAKNVNRLAKEADKLLSQNFGSVMDKKFVPPCGNMHEYMSWARYYWPDPSKPDGLPYIRKDGQKNPEIDLVSDDRNFNDIINAATSLSWAYYFTDDEKYAAKAIGLLRFWFLDTATRMLPNLNHAQMIKGIDTGRGTGIIDTHELPKLLDAIGFLRLSKSWMVTDETGIKQWFAEYLNWMMTSKNGIKESQVTNNHKTFYENQIASIALFVGKDDIAMKVFENAKKLIEHQIEADGKQPEELSRTLSLWYSTFNLQAWFSLAGIAEQKGVDLWNYQTADNRSLRKAFDYLLPYALNEKPWPHQQISEYKTSLYYALLIQAAEKYKDNSYKKAAEKIKSSNVLLDILYQ
ncbi:MAG: hypothetical protein C0459_05935 [Chitinophaga sp.]|jgi:Alginate lyase|nr:hypothetical protein [Chitinophaga sp.]